MPGDVSELLDQALGLQPERHIQTGTPIEVGSIVEGIVVMIEEYGAIVRLEGGKTGLIHISKIADCFVREVKDYFKEDDRVYARVLSINDKGRYELSTKGIGQLVPELPSPHWRGKAVERVPEPVNLGPEEKSLSSATGTRGNFEDLFSRFMEDSQEHQRAVERQKGAKLSKAVKQKR